MKCCMLDRYPLLSQIQNVQDLKELPEECLTTLAQEIRAYIMDIVSRNGGHLASNLGVVELTIALHRVFDSPEDKIVWDVGHQCYTHKILTGRASSFPTLRCFGGLSGFPKKHESVHDIVETGHSSTSISSSLGIQTGQILQGINRKVIAVIGDGALTGGLAWEGLNNTGHLGSDLIIVLNDNKMSIGENVGALSSYLSRLTATMFYQAVRKRVDGAIKGIPLFGNRLLDVVYRLKKGLKALIFRENLFSDLGFEYVGPIDGHNMRTMDKVFRNVKRFYRPVVVHVVTQKGKGYYPAEGDPTLYHGVTPFTVVDGKLENKGKLTFTEAFSGIITALAAEDDRIVAITAAMMNGTGLTHFHARFPERCFDTGITEQHAVTFAAGLALTGLKPVVAIYSTFMQRAVDQVIHDVALPKLPVIFALDRCGLVGSDGETHHGVFDLPLFRAIPGLMILAPANRTEMELFFRYAFDSGGPVIIRYPRAYCAAELDSLRIPLQEGRGVFVNQCSRDILLISVGGMLTEVCKARDILSSKGIACDIYNVRFLKPIDTEYLSEILSSYTYIFLVEENVTSGSISQEILYTIRDKRVLSNFYEIGIPDCFITHGKREQLLKQCGLHYSSIADRVITVLEQPGNLRIYRV